MFRVLSKGSLGVPVAVAPGDKMELQWRHEKHTKGKQIMVAMAIVDVEAIYHDYVIFEATDELGAREGLGGMFCNLREYADEEQPYYNSPKKRGLLGFGKR